jgi:hypothetical protein
MGYPYRVKRPKQEFPPEKKQTIFFACSGALDQTGVDFWGEFFPSRGTLVNVGGYWSSLRWLSVEKKGIDPADG